MKLDGIAFWPRIALLFLIRSGRSTASLSVMVITAVSALIFLSALSVGVNDAMLRNTVGLFSGHITGYELPASLHPEALKTEGVDGVLKRVCMPGALSNGNLGQSLTICGVEPRAEAALTALEKKVLEGGYPESGRAGLLISKPIAEELGARVGTTLSFISPSHGISQSFTVSGIYRTQTDMLDRSVALCPLDALPSDDAPWSAAIFLHQGTEAQGVIEQYRRKALGAYRFESWETIMPDLRQLIDLEYISMGVVIVLVFGVVSVGIACSFVIFIIRNIREYGIMKAMGVTTAEMSMLIVMKVLLMNLFSCGVGFLIGVSAVWGVAESGGLDITAFTSHNRYFAVSGVIYPRLTTFSLSAPPTAAFLFSLMAAVWPAALLARRKAADIIRMI